MDPALFERKAEYEKGANVELGRVFGVHGCRRAGPEVGQEGDDRTQPGHRRPHRQQ